MSSPKPLRYGTIAKGIASSPDLDAVRTIQSVEMLIRDLLASGAPSISFEFFPPKSDEAAAQLERTITELGALRPTFVSVTYGAGGSTREKTLEIVTRIKRSAGIEAMAHLTCVGSTREELASVVEKIAASGVQNLLALRGDPPKGQSTFTPVEGGFRYASELTAFIRSLRGTGLCIGGAAYPEKHVECGNPAVDLNNLKRKVDAGLDFVITQLFFDNRRYWEFVERAEAAGVRVPIIPGIMPITNAAQVERFTVACGATLPFKLAAELDRRRDDPRGVMQLGVAHATSQCIDLLSGGAPGIHFYTLNRSNATKDIFTALKSIGLAGSGESAVAHHR
jgi:methylenetetrahydrofolate reductase (NADPH)